MHTLTWINRQKHTFPNMCKITCTQNIGSLTNSLQQTIRYINFHYPTNTLFTLLTRKHTYIVRFVLCTSFCMFWKHKIHTCAHIYMLINDRDQKIQQTPICNIRNWVSTAMYTVITARDRTSNPRNRTSTNGLPVHATRNRCQIN